MFCGMCGTKLKEGTRFCPQCGSSILEQYMPDEKNDSMSVDNKPSVTDNQLDRGASGNGNAVSTPSDVPSPLTAVKGKKKNGYFRKAIAVVLAFIAVFTIVWLVNSDDSTHNEKNSSEKTPSDESIHLSDEIYSYYYYLKEGIENLTTDIALLDIESAHLYTMIIIMRDDLDALFKDADADKASEKNQFKEQLDSLEESIEIYVSALVENSNYTGPQRFKEHRDTEASIDFHLSAFYSCEEADRIIESLLPSKTLLPKSELVLDGVGEMEYDSGDEP